LIFFSPGIQHCETILSGLSSLVWYCLLISLNDLILAEVQ